MRKLLHGAILVFGLLGLVHESSAQFCPGAAPWVFDDVPASDPFCGYITNMAERGITLGCAVLDANHRLYCPFDGVTRGQMAAFIGRFGDVAFVQGGNAFGAPAILGTTDAQPFEVRVGGGRALRIERNGLTVNLIAGHSDNSAAPGILGATIAGGGRAGTDANFVGASYAAVGGGFANDATGQGATVAGGIGNAATNVSATVSGGQAHVASGYGATIAGGSVNAASGEGSAVGGGAHGTASGAYSVVAGGWSGQATGMFSVVGGGYANLAGADRAAVLGGNNNKALASNAVVLGGESNNANGPYSYVIGYNALTTANAIGSFVFSDNSVGQFGSGQPNEFLVGATGGIGMYTSKIYASGCKIAAGGAQWQCFSSRDGKTDLRSIDPADVLDRVIALPISTWRYRGEDAGIRHLGPMAQDFHAAFGLGDENTSIGVLDGSGVALAAIQGLHAQLRERDSAIVALRAQLSELSAAVQQLRRDAGR